MTLLERWLARWRARPSDADGPAPDGTATRPPAALGPGAALAGASRHRRTGAPADARPGTIRDAQWIGVLRALPFVRARSRADLARLRELCEAFLARWTVTGVAGAEPGPRERLTIAVQACLPVLELGLRAYEDFREIVVYPGGFLVPRTVVDDAGVVHEELAPLIGEAIPGGPVVLSWQDIAEPPDAGGNVVIHEFVHKIDMLDGVADGCPPLPPGRERAWRATLADALERLRAQLEAVEAAIPPDVDPESEDADSWYGTLPLDPYAATDEAEFFAVASEAFFVDATRLAKAFPEFTRQLADFYRQAPLLAPGPRASD